MSDASRRLGVPERASGQYVSDILSQPKRLRALLRSPPDQAELPAVATGQRIVLTGMGASLSALWPAWLRLASAGFLAWLVETGELLHDVAELMAPGALISCASQSGRSGRGRRSG